LVRDNNSNNNYEDKKEENRDDVPKDIPMIASNLSGISCLAIEPSESDSELAEINARLIAGFNNAGPTFNCPVPSKF
jgi:hypothetical protein